MDQHCGGQNAQVAGQHEFFDGDSASAFDPVTPDVNRVIRGLIRESERQLYPPLIPSLQS